MKSSTSELVGMNEISFERELRQRSMDLPVVLVGGYGGHMQKQ